MKFYEKNIGTTEEGEPIIKFITIPEVTLSEYAEQLEVSNEEALAILDADIAIDDHLDTALELE